MLNADQKTEPKWLCGIDMGSANTASYVAWLCNKEFFLDIYRPTRVNPLPAAPAAEPRSVACYAIDAPQGLPALGQQCRSCDRQAQTPTRRLPANRVELATWKLYGGLVRCGVEVFWSALRSEDSCLFGFEARPGIPVLAETYPRKTLFQLGVPHIPSKSDDSVAYIDVVWSLLQSLGYRCDSVIRPTVDQVDSMLCALAAEALRDGPASIDTFGEMPIVDEGEGLLREGYIACPARRRV